MPKPPKTQDVAQFGHNIVQQLIQRTGGEAKAPPKNPAAVALGRLGGLKGGPARVESTTIEQRREFGRIGAQKRWGK
jgi:hypothetical protein